jgi:predicted ArsR family transcriptional regulator
LNTKAEQLEWRRAKVTEYRAIGLSYAEIAQQLQVSKTAIAEDMQHLREHAKASIKEYATDHLPEHYQLLSYPSNMLTRMVIEFLTFPRLMVL